MQLLLERGYDAGAHDADGDTPLSWLCMHRSAAAELLVGRCGVEIALATIVAHVLVCVCRVDHVDAARFLLRHGASVNAPETSGDTALKAALPHRDVVYLLLANRALLTAWRGW